MASSTAGAWRSYPRPSDVFVAGIDGAKVSQELFTQRARDKSGREQVQRKRASGFPGHAAELGHRVVWRLRRRGYSHTVAQLAGHLVSVGGPWNFQGNRRLGKWIGRCDRTVRRARARLEADGWIRSFLLLPGDKVSGQRAAVVRPQVVRDVSRLERLAAIAGLHSDTARRASHTPPASSPRRSTAAEVPPPPPAPEATADELEALGRARPEFARFFAELAAAKRRSVVKPPPNAANPPPTPTEIDEWDRETERMERAQREPERGRDPPN